jgi:hypothetical protein
VLAWFLALDILHGQPSSSLAPSTLGQPSYILIRDAHVTQHITDHDDVPQGGRYLRKAHAIDPEREKGPLLHYANCVVRKYDGERPTENPAPIYLGHVATVPYPLDVSYNLIAITA